MKFTAHEDIEAPIDAVFAEISDFDAFERAALRRGADVSRTDDLARPAAGMRWSAQFIYRNRKRRAELELIEFDGPHALRVDGLSGGMVMVLGIDLLALSRQRTRMSISTDLAARSMSSRLVLQSLRLAKSTLQVRYCRRVADFALGIERRQRDASSGPTGR